MDDGSLTLASLLVNITGESKRRESNEIEGLQQFSNWSTVLELWSQPVYPAVIDPLPTDDNLTFVKLRTGWEVAVSLVFAAASATSVILSLLDIGQRIAGPGRNLVALASFLVFVASVGSLLYRFRKERDDLKASLVPKVQIVFDENDRRPYLQRTLLQLAEDVRGEEWRYRIGVRNLGKTEIPRVRAVLEWIEPVGTAGFKRIAKDHIYPGQPLQAMGKPPNTDEFLLGVSGEEPSVYVDVAYDHLTDEGATKMICFAYASTDIPAAAVAGTYRVSIRVEGGGTYDVKTFVVDRDGKDKRLRMRPE